MSKQIAASLLIRAALLFAAGPPDFVPDGSFKGSSLNAWKTLGDASWKAVDGQIAGTPKTPVGGWLVFEKSFQDVQFFSEFLCAAGCKAGVLLRATKNPDGGMKGVFVSLTEGDLSANAIVLDAQGKEVRREKLVPPPNGRGGRGGRGGGPALRTGNEWNELNISLVASGLQASLNGRPIPSAPITDAIGSYGAFALYVGGSGDARFKEVAWKDVNTIVEPKEQISSRFTAQRLIDYYYGWSVAAADVNHDGIADLVSGPFFFIGPSYTERRIYREGRIYNPATEYAPDMVNYAADFTGDGWPDILSSNMDATRAMDLYVNPKGESRRWDKYRVLPDITTELVLLKDIDGDGKPEIIYGGANGYAYAKPDPAHPTDVWPVHVISTGGRAANHGLGVGDINGDGRKDLVTPGGWYEQPPAGSESPWTFHAGNFGSGGAEMGVYDVNGDGLNDIVTSLQAHDWGLAWFEQKRAQDGTISFVQHNIAGDYSTKNSGNVVFSEPHGSAFADFDGDGIPDFVVGKSFWHHLENYNGPDPYGPAVLYIYRTVRNPKAEGGAEFVPEMVSNRSGVGSTIEIADLNKDGALDIAVATGKGTFIFFGKPGSWGKPSSGGRKPSANR